MKTQKPKIIKESKNIRPPINEVHALWRKSYKLNQLTQDDDVLAFLQSRELNLDALARTGVARVTPNRRDYDWPKWWPGGRSMMWRLIVPAFDTNGTFCSLHARAIGQTNGAPKTLWPSGFQAGGLFMPNRHAVKMLKGDATGIDSVLFVEGITDFLKVVSEAEQESLQLAVFAGTSGSFGSVSKINIPDDVDVYIGTDPDAKGDEYAQTIQMQLSPRTCYRLALVDEDGGDGARS
jgi:5S rRNA maturation endonuclease (ribonuclease M5)